HGPYGCPNGPGAARGRLLRWRRQRRRPRCRLPGREVPMTGRVIHFEIPFDDKERAKRFYADVFGWEQEEMPELDYVGVSTGLSGADSMASVPWYSVVGTTVGDSTNAATVVVILSEDMAADLARVTEHGGEVVAGREPVADMGFAAYFKDSEGNVVG